jgi:hypothetical protein
MAGLVKACRFPSICNLPFTWISNGGGMIRPFYPEACSQIERGHGLHPIGDDLVQQAIKVHCKSTILSAVSWLRSARRPGRQGKLIQHGLKDGAYTPNFHPTRAALSQIVAVDAAAFASALGAPDFNVSEDPTVHMESSEPLPIGTPPNVVAAPSQSPWQTACIGLRTIIDYDWMLRGTGTVATIPGVTGLMKAAGRFGQPDGVAGSLGSIKSNMTVGATRFSPALYVLTNIATEWTGRRTVARTLGHSSGVKPNSAQRGASPPR